MAACTPRILLSPIRRFLLTGRHLGRGMATGWFRRFPSPSSHFDFRTFCYQETCWSYFGSLLKPAGVCCLHSYSRHRCYQRSGFVVWKLSRRSDIRKRLLLYVFHLLDWLRLNTVSLLSPSHYFSAVTSVRPKTYKVHERNLSITFLYVVA